MASRIFEKHSRKIILKYCYETFRDDVDYQVFTSIWYSDEQYRGQIRQHWPWKPSNDGVQFIWTFISRKALDMTEIRAVLSSRFIGGYFEDHIRDQWSRQPPSNKVELILRTHIEMQGYNDQKWPQTLITTSWLECKKDLKIYHISPKIGYGMFPPL